uniref:CCR4-NOT transcription complex subunit 11 n=1 Tax=Mesocestoides corti TaxID=53468 RepID=A0A5K3FV84_MESCO
MPCCCPSGNITGSKKEQKKSDQCELTNLVADLPKYGFCQAAISTLFDPDLTDDTSNRQRIMGAILHISRICSPSEMFPHKPEVKRRKVRKFFDKWIRETRKEAEEEAKENMRFGMNYYDELLRLLENASYSILRLPETKQV